jgi:esterase/lipase superfamily enzyme
MNREYHKWHSSLLFRQMELLVFGHAGLPVLVFPTSCGRFFDFEDHGMIAAAAGRIDAGDLQFFCVDSIDHESWYNRQATPRQRIARHGQFEQYILGEVLPFIRAKNPSPHLVALGCSFGGYHAANIALRHPGRFTGLLALSGAFDLSNFLSGYYDQDCYFHLPTHYLSGLTDPWYLGRYRQNSYVLVTGWDDQCLSQNQTLDRIMTERGIPHQLHIWDARNSHDWPAWQRQMCQYL